MDGRREHKEKEQRRDRKKEDGQRCTRKVWKEARMRYR